MNQHFRNPVIWLTIILLAVAFHFDNNINHTIFRFWWIPIIAGFVYLQIRIVNDIACSAKSKQIFNGVSIIAVLLFVLLFNETATLFLCGIWMLITTATKLYLCRSAENSKKPFLTIGALISLSLLLLPVGVNMVSVKLPDLSGMTHFTIYNDFDDHPISAAHFYQRQVNFEEQWVNLSSTYFPEKNTDTLLLELRNDQDGVKFFIENIKYRHSLGLFDKTLYDIGAKNMHKITPHPASDATTITRPELGGIIVEDLAIDNRIWLQLPGISENSISNSDKIIIITMRLLFWLLVMTAVAVWRPRQSPRDRL